MHIEAKISERQLQEMINATKKVFDVGQKLEKILEKSKKEVMAEKKERAAWKYYINERIEQRDMSHFCMQHKV